MNITLSNLTKCFPSRNKKEKDEVIAVNNFNFTIPSGTLVGLLGPSGCGKSTALNLICGLLNPTKGTIFFGDEDVTKLPPEKRGVGLVFQNYALYPHLTVGKNIRFPLENLRGADKLTKADMDKRVYEAATLVQIENLLDRKPKELSGGQQQRVAIARALVKLPRVLLLDEPLSNLDARLRLQTREEIKKIQQKTQITTVFVTHDQDEAMSISDIIIVMKNGLIQQIGEPQKVYDSPDNLFVAKFLGTPPINVFNGHIENNSLYIGEDCILKNINIPNKKVIITIRPEGFILDKNGPLNCCLNKVEVMGRDVSIVSSNSNSLNPDIRSIIDTDNFINFKDNNISFTIKPHKLFIFDSETEERIHFSADGASVTSTADITI